MRIASPQSQGQKETMPYCPNPECPHRRRSKKPAELVEGMEFCPDCGTRLSSGDLPVQDEKGKRAFWPRPLVRRSLITAATLVVLWLLMLVPSPFIDLVAARALVKGSWLLHGVQFGPFSLGIMPLVSAFILVELFALCVPPFRRRRHNDPAFRRKLVLASAITAFCLCLAQGFTNALLLESMSYSQQMFLPKLVPNPGWAFRLSHTLMVTCGTFILLGVAFFVSRAGVGNGFAVLILFGLICELPRDMSHLTSLYKIGELAPIQLFTLFLGTAVLFVSAWLFLSRKAARSVGGIPLRLPTCGLLPVEISAAVVLLAAQLGCFFDLPWMRFLQERLHPGSRDMVYANLGLIALFTPIASVLFYWRRRKELRKDENRKQWRRAWITSGICLAAFLVGWHLLGELAGRLWRFMPTLLTISFVTVILMDLASEIRARKSAFGGCDLVPLAFHQDMVDSLEDQAQRAGEHTVVRGLFYRSLTYFFAPFVPLVLLGPEKAEQKDETASPAK